VALVVLAFASASSCAGRGTEAGASVGGAGPRAGSAGRSSAGAGPLDAGEPSSPARWATVREAVLAAAEAADVDLSFSVWDARDEKRFEVARGAFDSDTRVAVASASKHVSALVLFALIGRGALSLGSTTGEILDWEGDGAAIRLEHLLSFTSGLPPEDPCTRRPALTLAQCVALIAEQPLVAAPGSRFDYGSTHLHVAARMAEVVSGLDWQALFDETLRVPLGLPADVAYFTFPRQALGRLNPLIAGGLRASVNDYARILQVSFHRGEVAGLTLGTPALFAAQAREPFAVTLGRSPLASLDYPFRYGLGAWLECETPTAGCEVLSSPGAFGFTPWFDREAGYSAILGMEVAAGDDTEVPSGVVSFAVDLAQELKPLVRAALSR
jgi:serine-type D-Ala-D-Ala carboxypeptidase/endopeptidase